MAWAATKQATWPAGRSVSITMLCLCLAGLGTPWASPCLVQHWRQQIARKLALSLWESLHNLCPEVVAGVSPKAQPCRGQCFTNLQIYRPAGIVACDAEGMLSIPSLLGNACLAFLERMELKEEWTPGLHCSL